MFWGLQSLFSYIGRDDLNNFSSFFVIIFPSPGSTFIRIDTVSKENSIFNASHSCTCNHPMIPDIIMLVIDEELRIVSVVDYFSFTVNLKSYVVIVVN